MRDIGVAEIGRQRNKVSRNLVALCAALLEDSRRKAVTKIVDAGRRARPDAILASCRVRWKALLTVE